MFRMKQKVAPVPQTEKPQVPDAPGRNGKALAAASSIKNAKPKVFLVDMDSAVSDALADAGVNATQGTFGKPYRVDLSSQSQPMRNSSRLPGYAEQEIIFVDLSFEVAEEPTGEVDFATDGVGIWVRCDRGMIDPRARSAMGVRAGFDRIVQAGGVVVVFASPKTHMTIEAGQLIGRQLHLDKTLEIDEWSFLSALRYVNVSEAHGNEISICEERSAIGKALVGALPGMRYECTLNVTYDPEDRWVQLAKNKFGETVALGCAPPSGGAILILPQLQDKASLVKELLANVLPALFPALFPGIEAGLWTHLPEYELGGVARLQVEREEAVKRHEAEMEKIASDIAAIRATDGWLHDLLTQTGDPLVEAVMAGLAELGFGKVVDMDKIRDRERKPRREDLQVQDISPTLVVDIKGISNFPGDEDAMQAFKHAALIMREQKRTDVYGISLINHQRHLPPLHRDNSMPFRKELVDVALQNEQGLMTTWDLYRLVINKRRHSWAPKDVKPVLYGHGRILPIPAHYVPLGRVTHVWKHAFGVDIERGSLRVGDRVAIEFDVFFEEEVVASLKVEDATKVEASAGDKTGIPWPDSSSRPKVGMQVYVASSH